MTEVRIGFALVNTGRWHNKSVLARRLVVEDLETHRKRVFKDYKDGMGSLYVYRSQPIFETWVVAPELTTYAGIGWSRYQLFTASGN